MDVRRVLAAGLIGLLAFTLLTGCEQQGADQQDGEQQEEGVDIGALVEAWAGSGHSKVVMEPAERPGCSKCHNGADYAAAGMDEAQEGTGTDTEGEAESTEATGEEPRPYGETPIVATDCRVCHTARGASLFESGEVTLPGSPDEAVELGKGAVCSSCHNARRPGEIDDERRSAPHYSSEADVLKANNGIRSEEMSIGSTSKHEDIEDSCVGCHMPEDQSIAEAHDFQPGTVKEVCEGCHEDIEDVNREAQADYDGDGQTEGFQDEVDGLMEALKTAVVQKVPNATDFASEGGQVVFLSDEETITGGAISDEAYLGAWNYLLIEKDGTRGIHNPKFTVQLLQQSYEAVSGSELENAEDIE